MPSTSGSRRIPRAGTADGRKPRRPHPPRYVLGWHWGTRGPDIAPKANGLDRDDDVTSAVAVQDAMGARHQVGIVEAADHARRRCGAGSPAPGSRIARCHRCARAEAGDRETPHMTALRRSTYERSGIRPAGDDGIGSTATLGPEPAIDEWEVHAQQEAEMSRRKGQLEAEGTSKNRHQHAWPADQDR